MINQHLIEFADSAGYSAVSEELRRAEHLIQNSLFTEATMRLGRATEASLYAVSREFGRNLQIRIRIPSLSNIQNRISQFEAEILKKKTTAEVKQLSIISKELSEAIAELMEKEDLRSGAEQDGPRGNDRIFREIISSLDDKSARDRLKSKEQLLRKIMNQRNNGAHACPFGNIREIEVYSMPSLLEDFQDFIQTLLDASVGERARRAFAEAA
jgi:hypothetical protein